MNVDSNQNPIQETLDQSRQLVIWGEAGQRLIEQAKVLVVGARALGREIIKSTSILGVGTIYAIDNYRTYGESFLDIHLEDGASAVRAMADLIPKTLNPMCTVVPVHSFNCPSLLDLADVDFIFDVSNDPRSQRYCKEFAEKKGIPLLVAALSHAGGIMSFYDPKEPNEDETIIDGFETAIQGLIMSYVFAGISVEEFRKSLFKRHIESFKDVRPTGGDAQAIDYYDVVRTSVPIIENVRFCLIGDKRHTDPRNLADYALDGTFRDTRAILVGCGATGTYSAELWSNLEIGVLDTMDGDRYVRHNIPRQPVAYDLAGDELDDGTVDEEKLRELKRRVGWKKCEGLSKKIQAISRGKTSSTPYFGRAVGPNDERSQKHGNFDIEWFRQQNYDLILGCVDRMAPRAVLSDIAIQLGAKYIDVGSSPTSSSAYVYVPGVTQCLNCSRDVTNAAELEKIELEERAMRNVTNYRCIFIEGSVNMSNQTAVGMGAGEARRVINPSLGRPANCVAFNSNLISKLQSNTHPRCKCDFHAN